LIDWIGPFRHVGEWIGAREKRIAWILVFYAVAIVSMALFDLRAKASHVMPEVWGFLDATLRGTQLAASDGGDLVPVVLVDIDEASARKWGFQGHTPRDRLARVLEVISRAQPAAIVVDVDLSDDPHCPCFHDEAGDKALRAFIERYPGKAPLVFVKRTEADAEGRTTIAPSPYDPLFARSGSVSWAHAHFVADADGVTRRWVDSIAVCDEHGRTSLPAAAVRVLANAQWGEQHFERPELSALSGSCMAAEHVSGARTLIRSQALGARGAVSRPTRIGRLPAWMLTETGYSRNDDRLFRGNVAVIGNTHARATDRWRTPEGVEPGVLLLADTIRFAPRQFAASRDARFWWPAALLLVFCLVRIFFRPGLAALLTVAISLWFVWHHLRAGHYGVLDELETVLVALALIAAAEDLLKFITDLKRDGLAALRHPEMKNERHRTSA
jgi:CHASE2 domain-containing sensor protein